MGPNGETRGRGTPAFGGKFNPFPSVGNKKRLGGGQTVRLRRSEILQKGLEQITRNVWVANGVSLEHCEGPAGGRKSGFFNLGTTGTGLWAGNKNSKTTGDGFGAEH